MPSSMAWATRSSPNFSAEPGPGLQLQQAVDLPAAGARHYVRFELLAPFLVFRKRRQLVPGPVQFRQVFDHVFRLDRRFERAHRSCQQPCPVGLQSDLGADFAQPALHHVDHVLLVSEFRVNAPACNHHDSSPWPPVRGDRVIGVRPWGFKRGAKPFEAWRACGGTATCSLASRNDFDTYQGSLAGAGLSSYGSPEPRSPLLDAH